MLRMDSTGHAQTVALSSSIAVGVARAIPIQVRSWVAYYVCLIAARSSGSIYGMVGSHQNLT